MAATLKIEHVGRITLTEAARLIGSLKPEERAIIEDLVAKVSIFGFGSLTRPDHDHAVFSRMVVPPGKKRPKKEFKRIEGVLPHLRNLVRTGWLRFADVLGEGNGYFYLTTDAEAVWRLKRS